MNFLKKNIPWNVIFLCTFCLLSIICICIFGYRHFYSISKSFEIKIQKLENTISPMVENNSNIKKEVFQSLSSFNNELQMYRNKNIKILISISIIILSITLLTMLAFYIIFKKTITGIAIHITNSLKDKVVIPEYIPKLFIFRPLVSSLNKLIYLNNQLKLKLEVIPVPVIELDNNFHISFINSASAELLKCDKKSAIGKLCKEIIRSEKCQEEECPCQHARKTSGVISVQTKLVMENDNIPVEFTVVPFNRNSSEKGFILCLTDLSLVGNIVSEVKGITEKLNSTSDLLSNMASDIIQSTEDIVELSEQSALGIDSMATLGMEMSENIANQAESAQKMTKSLKDVSINTAKANQISNDAKIKTSEVNAKMKALVEASEQIGKVITVINDIADRTDLLALNAAIEAEGAGVAGKGFAVVADEVQKLAKQSADATDEIAQEIENIQTSTQDAVYAMEKISTIIDEIASINEKNASAVQEQTQTAADISNHTNQTVQAGVTVANSANDAHNLVNDISDKIKQTADQAESTNKTSRELATMASELIEIINQLNL